jgi:hypothetical protein
MIKAIEDPRLAKLSKICLALPHAERSVSGDHAGFRVSREPKRFYLPAYIGPRGWFGLRLDRKAIDWAEVRNLVQLSYCLVAPKTLVKVVESRPAAQA